MTPQQWTPHLLKRQQLVCWSQWCHYIEEFHCTCRFQTMSDNNKININERKNDYYTALRFIKNVFPAS